MNDSVAGIRAAQAYPSIPKPDEYRRGWYRLLASLLGGETANESVATRIHFDASPRAVWDQMMFYEEVPGLAPWLMRLFLPVPVRTDGDKRVVGAMVRCAYNGGGLIKRITAVEEPHLVRFEVIEQHLGIESCIATRGGSYEIRAQGDGADAILTTNYAARLRPRRLWRPLEKLLASRLHRHIFDGMSAALACAKPAPASARRLASNPARPGDLACSLPQSRFPR